MRPNKKSSARSEKKSHSSSQKKGAVGYNKKSALLEEAITQMNAGKYSRSSTVLKELLALDPHNAEGRRLFATLHLRLGSLMTARSAFESLANEALDRQDFWLAESLLREYLAVGPRCVPFLEMLGHVYGEKGDPVAAVAEYGKAIEVLLEDPDPDRPERAAELFAKIRELEPDSPVAFRLASLFDSTTGQLIAPQRSVSMETGKTESHPTESHAAATEPARVETPPWEQVEDFVESLADNRAPLAETLNQKTKQAEVLSTITGSTPTEIPETADATPEAKSKSPVDILPSDTGHRSKDRADEAAAAREAILAPQQEKREQVVTDGDQPSLRGVGIDQNGGPMETHTSPEDNGARRSDLRSPSTSSASSPMPWDQIADLSLSIPDAKQEGVRNVEEIGGAAPGTEPSATAPEREPLPELSITTPSLNAADSHSAVDQENGADQAIPAVPASSDVASMSWEEILAAVNEMRAQPNRDDSAAEKGASSSGALVDQAKRDMEDVRPDHFSEDSPAFDIPESQANTAQSPPLGAGSLSTPMPWERVEDASMQIPEAEAEVEKASEMDVSTDSGQAIADPSVVREEPTALHGSQTELMEAADIVPIQQVSTPESAAPESEGFRLLAPEVPPEMPFVPERATASDAGLDIPQGFRLADESSSPASAESQAIVDEDREERSHEVASALSPTMSEEPVHDGSLTAHEADDRTEEPIKRRMRGEKKPEPIGPPEPFTTHQPPTAAPQDFPAAEEPEALATLRHPDHHEDESEEAIETLETEGLSGLSEEAPRSMPERGFTQSKGISILEDRQDVSPDRGESGRTFLSRFLPRGESLDADATQVISSASQDMEDPVSLAESAQTRRAVAAEAVDTLFGSTGPGRSVPKPDKTSSPKPRKPLLSKALTRVHRATIRFVGSCFSTTRAAVLLLISLAVAVVAAGVLSLGGIGLLWVLMEEQPSTAFHNLKAVPQHQLQDPAKNGYLLLLGFDTNPGRDPVQTGYERKFESADIELAKACVSQEVGERVGRDGAPRAELATWFKKADPAALFQGRVGPVSRLVGQEALTMRRYQQWLAMTFEDWGYGKPISPNCGMILHAHRLYIAEGFSQSVDIGVDRLESDVNAWRTALAQAKTLPVKMMASHAITEDLFVMSGLLTRVDLDERFVGRLAKLARPLDQVEQSIRWPMQSQFVLEANTLEIGSAQPRVDADTWIQKIARAMPLPKQRRLNAYADYYEAATKAASEGRYGNLPKLSSYIRTSAESWLDYLLNPVEHLVGAEPLPTWERYGGRILDTDARLRLVGLQAWVRRGSPDVDVASRVAKAGQAQYDPFTGFPMLINRKKGVLYSVGHDGNDNDAHAVLDVAVPIPRFGSGSSIPSR